MIGEFLSQLLFLMPLCPLCLKQITVYSRHQQAFSGKMTAFIYSSFNLQKTVAEQNLEDTRQQLLAARSSQAKAIDVLETRVLTSLAGISVSGW